jgi:hypothetical protein
LPPPKTPPPPPPPPPPDSRSRSGLYTGRLRVALSRVLSCNSARVLQVRIDASEPAGRGGGIGSGDRMESETCRMCGGDGRIGNALGGSSAKCPSCHGSGVRTESAPRFHDVTKTKPSHYRPVTAIPAGPRGPTTSEGAQLAAEVSASANLTTEAKARLVAEILNHEGTHGRCTKTFIKKVRKQARPSP